VLEKKAQEEKLARDKEAFERIERAYRADAESRARFDEANETVVTARNALRALVYDHQRKELALTRLQTIDTDRATIELRQAELEVQAQAIVVENIQNDLSRMRLTSPASGIVLVRTMARGEWVTRDTTVLTLALLDPLVVRLRFPEREVGLLRPGQPVRASSPTSDRLGIEIVGEVAEVSQAIEATSGTVQVLVRLTNPPPAVRPGMLVRCRVEVVTRDNAVIVPKRAVIRQGGVNRVFRVEEGRAVEVPVELGYERDDEVEILGGLSEGDLVVTIGNKTLQDGTPIEVLPVE
jgi:RND family efflux transporter MFP subunit